MIGLAPRSEQRIMVIGSVKMKMAARACRHAVRDHSCACVASIGGVRTEMSLPVIITDSIVIINIGGAVIGINVQGAAGAGITTASGACMGRLCVCHRQYRIMLLYFYTLGFYDLEEFSSLLRTKRCL